MTDGLFGAALGISICLTTLSRLEISDKAQGLLSVKEFARELIERC